MNPCMIGPLFSFPAAAGPCGRLGRPGQAEPEGWYGCIYRITVGSNTSSSPFKKQCHLHSANGLLAGMSSATVTDKRHQGLLVQAMPFASDAKTKVWPFKFDMSPCLRA